MKRRILKFLINWYSEYERSPAWLSNLIQQDDELIEYQRSVTVLSERLSSEADSWVSQAVTEANPVTRVARNVPAVRPSGLRTIVVQPAIALAIITLLVVGVLYWPRTNEQSSLGGTADVSPEQLQSLVAYGDATKEIAERVSFKTQKLAQVWSLGTQRLFVQQRETATDLAGGIAAAKSSLDQFFQNGEAGESSPLELEESEDGNKSKRD